MATDKSDRPLKPGKKKKKKGGKPGDKPYVPISKKAKKKKTSAVVLLIAIGVGFAGLIAVGGLLAWVVSRPGSVMTTLSFVPADCNVVRGVAVANLKAYPGYKAEVDKHYTESLQTAATAFAKAANQDEANFVDYLVIAKNRSGPSTVGTMYVFRTVKKIDPNGLPAAVGNGTPKTINGQNFIQMNAKAPGALTNSLVYCPSERHIVIIPPGPQQQAMASGSAAAKAAPLESYGGKNLDATTKTVIKGSIWLVVRATGGNKGYIADITGTVAADFKELDEQGKKSPTFGIWTTPGGKGITVGMALQCGSADEAKKLVKNLQNGPMGKYDESEAPNSLRSGGSMVVQNKKLYGEFMQYISYERFEECAFLKTKVSGESATSLMTTVNNPAMGTGSTDDGGGGGG